MNKLIYVALSIMLFLPICAFSFNETAAWTYQYNGSALPTSVGWTKASAGTNSERINDGVLIATAGNGLSANSGYVFYDKPPRNMTQTKATFAVSVQNNDYLIDANDYVIHSTLKLDTSNKSVRFGFNSTHIRLGKGEAPYPNVLGSYPVIWNSSETNTTEFTITINEGYDTVVYDVSGNVLINISTSLLLDDYTKSPAIYISGDLATTILINSSIRYFWFADTIIPPEIPSEDTSPPVINITSPANNSKTNVYPLNISFIAVDNGVYDLFCFLSNETDIFDSGTFTQSDEHNLTFYNGVDNIDDNFMLNITCFDNSLNNNSATQLFNVSIDTIYPVMSINSPLNNSVYYINQTTLSYEGSCTDNSLLYFNVTMSELSSGDMVFSKQNNTLNPAMLLKGDIDISVFAEGLYSVKYVCADPHTATTSKILGYEKNVSSNEIEYSTYDGNKLIISSEDSDLAVCDFGSYSFHDKEVFWYDFETCNGAEPPDEYDFVFNINAKDGNLKFLSDSKYKGHFVTKENYVTFDIDGEEKYSIRQIIGSKYEVKISSTNRNFTFMHSAGGLNTAEEYLVLNLSNPVVSPVPIGEAYQVTQCYFIHTSSSVEEGIDNFIAVLGIIFFTFLAVVLMVLAKYMKHGILGIGASLILCLVGVYIMPCSGLIGFAICLLSMVIMWYYGSESYKGNL